LILAVLGSIVFGLATPTEAAAVGAFGGFLLAIAYRSIEHWRAVPPGQPKSRAIPTTLVELGRILKESSFLPAKTSAMVCWLFVALNLQTAFLSPPVAMAAFYLKGVAPPHVTLNQIFAGMMPFMAIQVIALVLLYIFPGIGLWLPHTLYK